MADKFEIDWTDRAQAHAAAPRRNRGRWSIPLAPRTALLLTREAAARHTTREALAAHYLATGPAVRAENEVLRRELASALREIAGRRT